MTGNIVQSTYSLSMSAGAAGAAATTHGWDADTRQAEGTIPFGLAVSKGDADNGAIKAGGLFVGVSMRDITLVHDTADQYETGDNMAVMTRGDIWVKVQDAVVAQTVVKFDSSTGELGADGGTTITGAVWRTSADAGAMAIVRLSGTGDDVTT